MTRSFESDGMVPKFIDLIQEIGTISAELRVHQFLLENGFPVASLIEIGRQDDSSYYQESDLGKLLGEILQEACGRSQAMQSQQRLGRI